MAVAYSSGTGGNVRLGAGSTVVAGITKWSIDKQLAMIPSPTFGQTADANGVYWTPYTLMGMADGTVDISGWYNTGDTTESVLYIGLSVTLDLLFETGTPYGYMNLAGRVMQIGASADVESTKPSTFSCKIRLTGSLAVPST